MEGLGTIHNENEMEEDKLEIKIKPKNVGKFTKYCKQKGLGSVTKECIEKGKKSRSKAVRKRAVFAENAREFEH